MGEPTLTAVEQDIKGPIWLVYFFDGAILLDDLGFLQELHLFNLGIGLGI